MFDFPPQFLIPIVAIIFGTTLTGVLLYPFVRAKARSMEPPERGHIPSEVVGRLARIEQAVESIAVEVERISENQRFLTKLQTERPPLSSGGTPPDRQR